MHKLFAFAFVLPCLANSSPPTRLLSPTTRLSIFFYYLISLLAFIMLFAKKKNILIFVYIYIYINCFV